MDVYSITFFLVFGVFFFWWSSAKQSVFAGLMSGFIFIVFGLLFIQTGIGYPASETVSLTQLNNYTNYSFYTANGSNLSDYPLVSNFTVSETKTFVYNTTRDTFTDGLGLLFILVGLFLCYETIIYYLQNRKAIAVIREKEEEDD